MTYRKKLIEVALPLDAINVESAREKSIRQGHPSTLHLWWSRKPLATCRAVIFASLVDDPSAHPDRFPTEDAQEVERRRLFQIIEHLVKWENINNKTVLDAATREIEKSNDGQLPSLLDPFCGGGSIPLEAERLGLEAYGSDLNPVAVLITKALIEIPLRFTNRPPVHSQARAMVGAGSGWTGARGLAEDVRHYSKWMRDQALERIGHLYPKVTLPKDLGGGQAPVIAWIWTRTVICPNPFCRAQMPLASKWWLSTKPGQKAWIEPIVDQEARTVSFEIRTGSGSPPDPPKISRGANFRCLVCGQATTEQYIKDEGAAGRMGTQLVGIVAEGQRGRVYLPPNNEHIAVAAQAKPQWSPDESLANDPRNLWCIPYGLATFADLFTSRQLVAMTTFTDLVGEARERVRLDSVAAGLPDDSTSLTDNGNGALAYADAVATYLGMGVSRLSDICNALCRWEASKTQVRNLFGRQVIPMIWEFAEPNVFAQAAGDFEVSISNLLKALEAVPARGYGVAKQIDATTAINGVTRPVISTDPPYYDNIAYADLSDFFYVWLRRSLSGVYPALFSTVLVPKSHELVATPYRFGGSKDRAKHFFEEGLGKAFAHIRAAGHPDFPVTIYYAFKQAEAEDNEDGKGYSTSVVASTGWETMLEGLLNAGFTITGTWPMRSELSNRPVASGTNALASSIVLVCRPRSVDAPLTTRRDFLNILKRELPDALKSLQHGNIAPVDLAQATIGPGMAIFSRYSKVLEADGKAMRVRVALQIINHALDEVLAEQEGEFDTDTRWALAWFEQNGTQEGPFGMAETLSKAKNTSIAGLAQAGLLIARGGKVRLLTREELPADWDPSSDNRLTVWEVTQHLIRALETEGESGAAALLNRSGAMSEIARDLAYRLYTICERKKWADEALSYNSLVISWPQISQLATQQTAALPQQQGLFT